MTCLPMALPVLDSLNSRPSRASAAAIGQKFVLNGAPPGLGLLGIDALGEMMCDWSVAILEEAVNDPTRTFRVRQYAITKLGELLRSAIDDGYAGISRQECRRLENEAKADLKARKRKADFREIRAVEDLCGHLSQAVADGVFGRLSDF